MNLYSGPASKVEVHTADEWTGSQVDFGEASEVEVNWEPLGKKLMDGAKTQNCGRGTLSIRLDEAGSTNLAVLKGIRNTRVWVRITLASGTTFTVLNIYLNYGYVLPLSNPEESTGFPLSCEKITDDVEDFCTIPTDS